MKNQEKQFPTRFTRKINKESKDHHTNLELELCIQANGKEDLEMVLENRLGQMEQNILESGVITELMVKESLFM